MVYFILYKNIQTPSNINWSLLGLFSHLRNTFPVTSSWMHCNYFCIKNEFMHYSFTSYAFIKFSLCQPMSYCMSLVNNMKLYYITFLNILLNLYYIVRRNLGIRSYFLTNSNYVTPSFLRFYISPLSQPRIKNAMIKNDDNLSQKKHKAQEYWFLNYWIEKELHEI